MLWKHHAAYLRDICNRKDNCTPPKPTNNTKFEIGQTVMVRNHVHEMFKPKYLTDYRVLKILNESTPQLVTLNGKDHKMNISDMRPCTTLELVENAQNPFLNSIKTNYPNH